MMGRRVLVRYIYVRMFLNMWQWQEAFDGAAWSKECRGRMID